jgi:hypothetical protein
VSNETGLPLLDILDWGSPLTHRQFVVASTWTNEQWNHPSRSDYYVMANTAMIDNVLNAFRKSPKTISLEEQKLKFTVGPREKEEDDPAKLRAKADANKAIWLAAFGIKLDAQGNQIPSAPLRPGSAGPRRGIEITRTRHRPPVPSPRPVRPPEPIGENETR